MRAAPADLLDRLPAPVRRFVEEHPDDELDHLDLPGRRRYALVLSDLTQLRYGRPPMEVAEIRELQLDDGIAARLYLPHGWSGGLHVHLHGGGFWAGSTRELVTDALCRRRAALSGVAVLAVEYRLAPEHPFPSGLEDAHRVVLAALGIHGRLPGVGHDPENVSLGGISAGGNLAAASTIELGTEAQRLRGLLLEVPALDLALDPETLPAEAEQIDEYRALLGLYLQDGATADDPRVSPLRAPSLRSFPPTVIQVSELDPLRGGGEAFARALQQAGVPTRWEVLAGALHGAAVLDRVWEPAQRWQDRVGELLQRMHDSPAQTEAPREGDPS